MVDLPLGISRDMRSAIFLALEETSAKKSSGNSTNTALGSAGEFTGAWEVNSLEHACINVVADQDGTLYVETAILKDGVDPAGTITDSDVVETLSSSRPIYADTAYFRPLVKMPGRAFRVRYVNGGTGQSSFALLTSYGNNLFPASSSDDNELLVTVTERERNLFAAVAVQDVTASGFRWLIDLSAQDRVGRVDLTNVYISVDRDSTATGRVRIGVITRVDGTNADVVYFQGVNFAKSDDRTILRDRNFSPSQIKCGVVAGETTRIKSVKETSIAGSAGSYNFAVSTFYHSETAA